MSIYVSLITFLKTLIIAFAIKDMSETNERKYQNKRKKILGTLVVEAVSAVLDDMG